MTRKPLGVGLLAAAVLGVGMWAAPPSSAFVFVNAAPSFPDSVVGQSSSGSIGIANSSTPPESTSVPVLTVSAIDLYPACSTSVMDCQGGIPAAGVYGLSATGTGSGPSSCTGTWTLEPNSMNPATTSRYRLVPPGGEGTLAVATGETCVVSFGINTKKVPPVDGSPGQPGVQAFHTVGANISAPGLPGSSRAGLFDSSTVAKATPGLSSTAALNGPPVAITDTASLSAPSPPSSAAGAAPTGTITFNLHGPDNATCSGTAVSSSTLPVTGFSSYQSSSFTPAAPGTYRYVVTYSGDANYEAVTAACNAPGESVTISTRRAVADFDGDGKTDLSVFRPGSSTWFVHRSRGGDTATTYGLTGDIPAPADYSGDGFADVANYRPSTGTWFIHSSSGGDTPLKYGITGDLPVPADYDGDGKADIAVFRPLGAMWFIHKSTGGDLAGAYGATGDVAVPGDYDGDGKADLAVFRPSGAVWFIQKSTGGDLSGAFGAAGDIPVPGDYDGDGKTDLAVFRPSGAVWIVSLSSGGSLVGAYGASGDLPMPGDYDGDGKTDLAVFRPAGAVWFIHKSTGGDIVGAYGATGDIPLPLPVAIRSQFF